MFVLLLLFYRGMVMVGRRNFFTEMIVHELTTFIQRANIIQELTDGRKRTEEGAGIRFTVKIPVEN
ncbi:MAG: hypothetical protein PHP30_07610 [Bacteroidales bacterium]|nr:hypothetical protein [Bacteroidales bacterium]MDD2424797.1 hypothetical protein [Bacteroidales bacterium]MDD3989942.1 hypothetical protein [Bacteroidales bacterium]MDD4638480.1 hypothetical protein [Bacteroidales bacterium]